MLHIALAQINATVGDVTGNCDRISAHIRQARDAGAQLILFPELSVSGYPPEDLLLREDFLLDCENALLRLAAETQHEVALIGFPEFAGRDLYNALAVCSRGQVQAVYRKVRLPNYGVFDEARYFRAGDTPAMIRIGEHQVGLTVCEDVWVPGAPVMQEALSGADLIVNLSASPYERGKGQRREQMLAQRARDNLAAIAYCNLVGGQDELIFDGQSMVVDHRGRTLMRAGQFTEQLAHIALDLSRTRSARLHDPRYRTLTDEAVPVLAELDVTPAPDSADPIVTLLRDRYHGPMREELVAMAASERIPLADRLDVPRYADVRDDVLELVRQAQLTQMKSGPRRYTAAQSEFIAQTVRDRQPLSVAPLPIEDDRSITDPLDPVAEVYEALKLGVRDYVRKSGFERVLLGLSGGVDSALVAMVAADALGPENVTCVVMPSVYSSVETQSDARDMGHRLGVDLREIAIKPMMEAYDTALADDFAGVGPDVTEENIQARIRGNLLMALSNKFGWLVLTTGNKSEMAVGYATLYGDMSGGFAVLKDVPKLLVFELCRWRNRQAEAAGQQPPVPWSIIDRPPSAELRDGQRDDQALPPYEVLDPILERFIEEDDSVEQIVAAGFDRADVERVVRLVGIAEYKRRQAPPGIKITPRAFGRDRRMPIVNRYRAVRTP